MSSVILDRYCRSFFLQFLPHAFMKIFGRYKRETWCMSGHIFVEF